MGDRAMAEIQTKWGSLFFYTHHCGGRLPSIAQEALSKAVSRKNDSAYCLKIVVDNLIKLSGARDSELHAGLMLEPMAEDEYNNDKPSVRIDLRKWKVTKEGRYGT